MTTLTLVPIGPHWINPEEIAAIQSEDHSPEGCLIVLKGRDACLYVNLPVDSVLDRLKNYDAGVASLAEAAEYLSAQVAATMDTRSDTAAARHWKTAVSDVDDALKALGVFH